jgi:arginyl-tRNA synthetase
MSVENKLREAIAKSFSTQFGQTVGIEEIKLELTNKDHTGDYTFVVFPWLKITRLKPEESAQKIGDWVTTNTDFISGFNVIKGFLNFELNNTHWLEHLKTNYNKTQYGSTQTGAGKTVLVEYSSPNTNKPLHLGHVRNNLLGYSLSEILKFAGYTVFKCNLINDRGIHICKSMLAWQLYGNGETPETSGLKGDHLVGKYYVEFDKNLQIEIKEVRAKVESGDYSGISEKGKILIQNLFDKLDKESDTDKKSGIQSDIKTALSKETSLMREATNMLQKWEAGDAEVIKLWKTMNGWVYDGFAKTYARMGVDFDKYYYESNTYLLGKDIVNTGLEKGVFTKDPDGSVWIDLTADGLDRKLVLRADGTSVYITQDIGTAVKKYEDWKMDHSVYVVGNEQDYHFKVLKLILQKLGLPFATGVYHLSYGMVDLPSGKMKSREGTVVDADELMESMYQDAKQITEELGKTEGLTEEALDQLYETIAMGALKYFLLKVDPQKRMLFNPAESIDFHGNTGPFIQYTHARIRSMLRNVDVEIIVSIDAGLQPCEQALLKVLAQFPEKVSQAALDFNPADIANYMFEVAKAFNRLYHEVSILGESDNNLKQNRLAMCWLTANTLRNGMSLLGITVPERM